jgi:hypothetical protein
MQIVAQDEATNRVEGRLEPKSAIKEFNALLRCHSLEATDKHR